MKLDPESVDKWEKNLRELVAMIKNRKKQNAIAGRTATEKRPIH